jgi:hypothetical protein
MSQSTEPSVCCVLLTANRPAMARQAVENFRAQTYANKRLTVYDTGSLQLGITFNWEDRSEAHWSSGGRNEFWRTKGINGSPIGVLRNEANEVSASDILIHWDDDDYSHPNRIAEQVALLQSSGADCVGYNEMLFWDSRCDDDAAWLYHNPDPRYALGTSLCYWRKTWERKPFEATSQGEDLRWIAGLNVVGKSSMVYDSPEECAAENDSLRSAGPRMIARIHPGNTSTAYDPRKMAAESKKKNPAWQRVPAWDEFCRSKMCANT